jgi:hypothetical protein
MKGPSEPSSERPFGNGTISGSRSRRGSSNCWPNWAPPFVKPKRPSCTRRSISALRRWPVRPTGSRANPGKRNDREPSPPRQAARVPSDLILVRRALPGAYLICRNQRGSHAEWPKDSHEHAPTQTCGVIFCPPKAVDTDCRPNPVERAPKRPKKLRAISGASPGGSAVGECRRRGELLPTRRALLQIDVFEPRGDIDRDVPSRLTFAADALGCCPSPKPRANRAAHALMPPFRLMNWPRAPESGLYAAVYRRARLHRSRSRHRNHLLFGWPLCKFRNRERMRSM